MHKPDIARITQGVRSGEENAFDRLYELYCDRLYRYLLVLSRGQEEVARDALQVAWTKVIQQLPNVDQEKKLWHWLATVARNSYFDLLRRQQRSPVIVPLMDDQISSPDPLQDDTILFEQLERSLADLDDGDQTLLRSYYFENQSHLQLAQKLGTTAKAIESKLARLRQFLHQTLIRRLRHEDS